MYIFYKLVSIVCVILVMQKEEARIKEVFPVFEFKQGREKPMCKKREEDSENVIRRTEKRKGQNEETVEGKEQKANYDGAIRSPTETIRKKKKENNKNNKICQR